LNTIVVFLYWCVFVALCLIWIRKQTKLVFISIKIKHKNLNENKIGGFLKKKNNQKLRKVIPYYAPQDKAWEKFNLDPEIKKKQVQW
jgi:hypothetical protein